MQVSLRTNQAMTEPVAKNSRKCFKKNGSQMHNFSLHFSSKELSCYARIRKGHKAAPELQLKMITEIRRATTIAVNAYIR